MTHVRFRRSDRTSAPAVHCRLHHQSKRRMRFWAHEPNRIRATALVGADGVEALLGNIEGIPAEPVSAPCDGARAHAQPRRCGLQRVDQLVPGRTQARLVNEQLNQSPKLLALAEYSVGETGVLRSAPWPLPVVALELPARTRLLAQYLRFQRSIDREKKHRQPDSGLEDFVGRGCRALRSQEVRSSSEKGPGRGGCGGTSRPALRRRPSRERPAVLVGSRRRRCRSGIGRRSIGPFPPAGGRSRAPGRPRPSGCHIGSCRSGRRPAW